VFRLGALAGSLLTHLKIYPNLFFLSTTVTKVCDLQPRKRKRGRGQGRQGEQGETPYIKCAGNKGVLFLVLCLSLGILSWRKSANKIKYEHYSN
jgi:hypothetical protein